MNCSTPLTATLAVAMLCTTLNVSAQHSPHRGPPPGGHAPPSFGTLPRGHAPFSPPPFGPHPSGHGHKLPPPHFGSLHGGHSSPYRGYGPPSGYHHRPPPPQPYYRHYYGYDDAWLAPAIIGAFRLGYLLSQPGYQTIIVEPRPYYQPYSVESIIYGE